MLLPVKLKYMKQIAGGRVSEQVNVFRVDQTAVWVKLLLKAWKLHKCLLAVSKYDNASWRKQEGFHSPKSKVPPHT